MKHTVLIDDTFHNIEINFKIEIYCYHRYEFSDLLEILLTDKQFESFVVNDTNREFKCSKKRIEKSIEYLNSESLNIWHKQAVRKRQKIEL